MGSTAEDLTGQEEDNVVSIVGDQKTERALQACITEFDRIHEEREGLNNDAKQAKTKLKQQTGISGQVFDAIYSRHKLDQKMRESFDSQMAVCMNLLKIQPDRDLFDELER